MRYVAALLCLAGVVAFGLHAHSDDQLQGLDRDLELLAGATTNDERLETLAALLAARGIPFERQTFANARPGSRRPEGTNLVMTFGDGRSDIVVGAHFDAAHVGTGITQGMIDNGAGTIVMTRVAGDLAHHRFRHRIRVVLFDLEEEGLQGSAAYVGAFADRSTVAMVNLDLAATGETIVFGPGASPGNSAVYHAANSVCSRTGLTCMEFPAYPTSDDVSFQAAGIANVSIGVMPRLDAHQMWLDLNGGDNSGLRSGFAPRTTALIHTAGDRLEEVESRAMQSAYRMVLETVLELDRSLPAD